VYGKIGDASGKPEPATIPTDGFVNGPLLDYGIAFADIKTTFNNGIFT